MFTAPSRSVAAREAQAPFVSQAACSVCGGSSVVEILALPQLPLTGIYVVDHNHDERYPLIDQSLGVCPDCGHGQLHNIVDQKFLYEDTYSHRGSESQLAIMVNEFFANWVTQLAGGKVFERVLDVGCGDLYLLRLLAPQAKRLLGIDPIWRGRDHEIGDTIRVRGGFVTEVDIEHELGGKPDLIIANHTFEHLPHIREQMQQLVTIAADGALLAAEVPSFDTLLLTSRFDQVFHQHVNYFSLASFRRLIQEIGGQYVAHTHNFSFWGGSLLMAWRKARGQAPSLLVPTTAAALASVDRFKRQMEQTAAVVECLSEPIVGFGAAQILPMLAYHLQSDLSFLEAVLDDNPRRAGLGFPYLPFVIRLPRRSENLSEVAVMVTALDSARSIIARATSLKARRIIVPSSVL